MYIQEYDLALHHDLHSLGHNQWFYFSVSNTFANSAVTFNITNLGKPSSLFNEGMRPLCFSQMSATTGVGWHRVGTDIKYYCNSTPAPVAKGREGAKGYYTLTFTHTFTATADVCFFAMCYPYTYTDLSTFLYRLQCDDQRRDTFTREVLCETLAGNKCDVVTITEKGVRREGVLEKRPGVVITARVHPGESNASWIMHGIIDFLTSDDPMAVGLRRKFVFKIVPMLNPDGVINGNYRTSLAGVDLNRRWDNPDEHLHPTIWHTKEMVKRFQKTRQVILQCDIHGHSRKEGLFVYGCVPDRGWEKYVREKEEDQRVKMLAQKMELKKEKEKGEEKVLAFGGKVEASLPRDKARKTLEEDERKVTVNAGVENLSDKLRARMFPRIFNARNDAFIFTGCSFRLQKSKASTMRIVMYEELGIVCSYTLEASFAGLGGKHFDEGVLKGMGTDFCRSLVDFADYLEVENQHQSVVTTRSPRVGAADGYQCSPDLDASGDWGGEDESEGERSGGWGASRKNSFAFPVVDEQAAVTNEIDQLLTSQLVFTNPLVSPLLEPGLGGLAITNPLNDLVRQEMAYLNTTVMTEREGDEKEEHESGGSDSDPSGDNLTEKELRKRLGGGQKKKKKTKKKLGSVGNSSANSRRVRSVSGPSALVGQRRATYAVDARPIVPAIGGPTRPKGPGNSVNVRGGQYSKTPRAMQSQSGTATPNAGAHFNRDRAQSANADERDRRNCPNGSANGSANDSANGDANDSANGDANDSAISTYRTDPRFVMDEAGAGKVLSLGGGLGIVRGPTRSSRNSVGRGLAEAKGIVGGLGDRTGPVSADELTAAIRFANQAKSKDLAMNLDFNVAGIGGGGGGGGGGGEKR